MYYTRTFGRKLLYWRCWRPPDAADGLAGDQGDAHAAAAGSFDPAAHRRISFARSSIHPACAVSAAAEGAARRRPPGAAASAAQSNLKYQLSFSRFEFLPSCPLGARFTQVKAASARCHCRSALCGQRVGAALCCNVSLNGGPTQVTANSVQVFS